MSTDSHQNLTEDPADADACIAILKLLDEYKTTYPNKVFDYMAAERPVILAIDGVIRAVVDAADCGLFAQPGNAVELARVIRELAKGRYQRLSVPRHDRAD
ncbi:MAG: hypothetical protein MUO77_04315 [Anaerolineales bacterium]|nr:hypothetical protein [Anaerolineales bacterium]